MLQNRASKYRRLGGGHHQPLSRRFEPPQQLRNSRIYGVFKYALPPEILPVLRHRTVGVRIVHSIKMRKRRLKRRSDKTAQRIGILCLYAKFPQGIGHRLGNPHLRIGQRTVKIEQNELRRMKTVGHGNSPLFFINHIGAANIVYIPILPYPPCKSQAAAAVVFPSVRSILPSMF